MAAIEKVKVVVLGDSGVGKTSLTYLVAHNKPLISPGWTVGCSVEVKLHKYKEGTQAQNTFFVELWDVGGSNGHRNTRDVFYQPTHGSTQIPILVIGTKFDLAEEKQRKNQYRRLASSIAEQCGADEIFVNCHQARSLAPGTTNSVKLTRFFDKVIERRYYSRISPFPDKRRIPTYMMSTSTPLSTNRPPQYMSPRFYHMD
ncbi:rab-like protein 3 isoform X2 [Amyelois transitella]|uniref:rab-like protein 3 isoform X2 n=1 Tax=Amyelois transitella TaxID=680683 RepID=UPI00067A888D|nr:rab-like protein 3 isoform X2 [Amyelois transitella]